MKGKTTIRDKCESFMLTFPRNKNKNQTDFNSKERAIRELNFCTKLALTRSVCDSSNSRYHFNKMKMLS